MGIGNRIGELLKNQGRTAAWLSRETGIPATTLRSMISRDSDRADIETLGKIAAALGCSVFDLIDREAVTSATAEQKNALADIAGKETDAALKKAFYCCELAGYKWEWETDHAPGIIHLTDIKTGTLYAVSDEAFTAAVNGSVQFIEFNFAKLIESAKIID